MEIKKSELLQYIEKEFNIDVVSYNLISELIDLLQNDVKKLLEILNNSRIDLTFEELKNNNLIINKEVK